MRCNIKLKKVTGQSIALRRGAFAEEDSCDCGGMSTPGHWARPLKKVLIFQVSESRIYELTL